MKYALFFPLIIFSLNNMFSQGIKPTITHVAITPVDCFGGSTGSVTLTVSGSAPFQYFCDSIQQSSNVFNNLKAGEHVFRVTNHFGSDEGKGIIPQPQSKLNVTCNGNISCGDSSGNVNATATGGGGSYQYTWTTSNGTVIGNTSSLSGLSAGIYIVNITDSNRCMDTCSVSLIQQGSSKPKYNIGDSMFCGYVFYVDTNNTAHPCFTHYLICAFTDQGSRITWYHNSYTTTNATTDILFDKANADLIDSVSDAAMVCSAYTTQDSCTGWYLPSKAELNLMYANLAAKNIGKFSTEGYLSSVEAPKKNSAWIVDFYNGNELQNDKSNKYHVRAVCEVWLRNE